jgi:hypothetical protein
MRHNCGRHGVECGCESAQVRLGCLVSCLTLDQPLV